jgi:hypothetical protein
VREHLEGGVDPAKDAIRAEALDQGQLRHALDRLQAIAEQLWDEHHQRREQDAAPGEGREDAERRCADAVQISAGPSPKPRMTR